MPHSTYFNFNRSSDRPVFAIIGGGIAGSVQAIHLAEKYPWIDIHVFDKNKEILSGTSTMNPGRPTFGFHYRHLKTATFCQDNTVKFTKFLDRIGCPNIFAQAPQGGIYVLMKDAAQILGDSVRPVFSPDEIEPIFEQIKDHAIKKYSNDNDFKKHFGPPDQLCRRLQEDEYIKFLTPELLDRVGSCYETAEKTFDTVGICSFLRGYIKKVKNIIIHTEANVTNLEQIPQSKSVNYRITWDDRRSSNSRFMVSQFLTLACWERVGFFRKQLGKPEYQPTYNRLKMLAILEIEVAPDRLDTIRPIFVASGPFSMISPQKCIKKPDGRIICRCACTLAVRTNVMNVPDDRLLPADYNDMLEGKISPEEKMEMATPILEGARQFFACLSSAKLVDVRFGTVRVPFGGGNKVDLHDPASEHHSRDYPGCDHLGEGLFVNEAMKMIYSVYNAEMVAGWAGYMLD
ncbi:hypothetical protein Dda_6162 [Drechslerella dactyloides]|uniref:FAD dependent oxidoreductase domain-containing protein n=1 Tax=Drechslerella dactyloides TaxID=74499 RepID=A0AAD6IV18_DREDA|nr:hypothetical protein Dda_6162 [Drechslerella dactyloides]